MQNRFIDTNEFQIIGAYFIDSYNWVIANQDLTIEQLKTLSSTAKIVALGLKDVTRKSPSSSATHESANRGPNHKSTKSIVQNNLGIEYLLDGIWVSRGMVFKMSGQIDWSIVGSLSSLVILS